MFSGDEIKLILMSSGVTISLTMLYLTIRNRIIDSRKKLLIKHECQMVFARKGSLDNYKFSNMMLNIHVTNIGKVNTFINHPAIKLPKMVDGFDTFQMLNMQDGTKFPLKLEPGESFKVGLNLKDFGKEFKEKVKNNDKIRFQVIDSVGNKYLSKKVIFSELIKHFKTEEMLLNENQT